MGNTQCGKDCAGVFFKSTPVKFKTNYQKRADIINGDHKMNLLCYYEAKTKEGYTHGWIVGMVKNNDYTYFFSISKFRSFVGFYFSNHFVKVMSKGMGKEANDPKMQNIKRCSSKTIGMLVKYSDLIKGKYNAASSNCNDFATDIWNYLG